MQFIMTQYLQQHLLYHRIYKNYAVVLNNNGFTGLIWLYLCHIDRNWAVQCVCVCVSL